MLLYDFIGQTVRTPTRDAASLSNRLLPAEAGKKAPTPTDMMLLLQKPSSIVERHTKV